MGKFQVRLLVLIALGTGAVVTSTPAFPGLDSELPMPENLRSDETEVTIPDSGEVYHRVTVRDVHLEFAKKSSVSLPSDDFLECAKAAAGAGLEAFVFDGNCTGYELSAHFLKNQTGDVVVYVRANYLIDEPVVVPLDEAPFKPEQQDKRMYMLSGFVETDDDHPAYKRLETVNYPANIHYINNYVYLENGDILFITANLVDLKSCVNDGAYGLRIDAAPVSYDFPGDVIYFFEECGNTVQVRNNDRHGIFAYSHRGLGCQYYPSDLPDECTVTFEGENAKLLMAWFGFFFSETGSDDGGLIMTITGNDMNGMSESQNMYHQNSFERMSFKTTIEVSLQRHPSKRAIGFFVAINLYDR